MKNFVLKGNIMFSESKTELAAYPDSFLVCEDGVCGGVFEELPDQYKDFPLFDYGSKIIVPGLVDMHIHAPQFSYRGTGMDLELLDWLNTQAFPEETKYADEEYAKEAYSIFADTLKNSATTRGVIFATRHKEGTEILMDLLEDTGLVTYVGKVNMDQNAPDGLREESAEVSALHTVEWLENVAGKYANTHPILTPRFIPSCTKELLEKLGEIREKYNLPVQSHLSENHAEIELVGQLIPEGDFYGHCYELFNLFGNRPGGTCTSPTVMAHCVFSGPEEMDLMGENGVFIAHCPASNLNLASGIAPVRIYLQHGLRVCLGSDVAGGQTESMFRAITDAIQVSKMYWKLVDQSVKPLTFEESFYMATIGGGEFFGKVGKFEKGYEFDAVVLSDEHLPHPQQLNLRQRLERFAYLRGDVLGIKAKYVAGNKIV